MKSIQRTSMLICATIFVAFLAAGAAARWPDIAHTVGRLLPAAHTDAPVTSGGDPFAYDPPLPSLVQDLHATYRITAELLPRESAIKGTVTVAFDNPGTPDIRLYTYDYPFSPMRIHAVRWQGGEIPYVKEGRVVTLPNVFEGEPSAQLTVEFVSSVPKSGTRFGEKDGVWTLTNWYPMLGALDPNDNWYPLSMPIGYGDPFVYHYGDYEVAFTSPAGYQWVSSWGRGEARQLPDGRQELRYSAKRILSFALVGSPRYHVERVQVTPGLTLDIAASSAAQVQRIREIAVPALETFRELFGDLPYPHVAVAETSRTDPLEYANIAIFGRDLFHNQQVEHWLPHEIAHMWWYNSVNTVEPVFGWIDEGLVEASVFYYRNKRFGTSAAEPVRAQFENDREQLRARYPEGMLAKRLEQFANFYEFRWTWYSSAALLYENLRQQIGDDAYFRFLKQVQTGYQGTVIGPEHLDQALSRVLNGQARYFAPNAERINREPFLPPDVEEYVETVVNGVTYYPAEPARIRAGEVYVPMRELAERLGWQVSWSQEGTIRLTRGERTVALREGSAEVTADGRTLRMTQPALEIRGRTMVPLSFFGEALGLDVTYDAERKAAHITEEGRNG